MLMQMKIIKKVKFVLEADAELQKREKTEDAVAAMNVDEDVRMESDGKTWKSVNDRTCDQTARKNM